MTAIVGMALGKREVPTEMPSKEATTANFLLPGSVGLQGSGHLDRRTEVGVSVRVFFGVVTALEWLGEW